MSTTLIVPLVIGAIILGVVLLFIGICNRLAALWQTGSQADRQPGLGRCGCAAEAAA